MEGEALQAKRGIRFGVREWLSAAKRWLSSFQLRFASRRRYAGAFYKSRRDIVTQAGKNKSSSVGATP